MSRTSLLGQWLRSGCAQTVTRRPPQRRREAGAVLQVEPLEARRMLSADVILQWNELLLQSLTSQPPRVPFARNMAMVHVAMFDAVNAIDRSYEPYHTQVRTSRGASQEAAAAQAAHDVLVALYPARQATFDAQLASDLDGIPAGRARQGSAVGSQVAQEILQLRAGDGSSTLVTYTPPNNNPGQWQPTPPDSSPAANAHVSRITPFAVQSSAQFRPGPPPALSSAEYATAFNEAKVVGATNAETADRDNNGLPDRTPDQTEVALLWRVPLPNHQVWNRIAQDVAETHQLSLPDTARLFALLDMSIADGLATSFGAKYHYELWRPVTAVRRADEDGNPATLAEATWSTLHPATPPYPTYSGNAATIGAASATVLASVLGTNDISFNVQWDPYGFPGVTRSYESFWDAANEMADSRIYGGIHFRFDNVAGQQIGADVAEYTMDHYLLPQGAVVSAPGAAGDSRALHTFGCSGGYGSTPFNIDASTVIGSDDAVTRDDRLVSLIA